MRQPCFFSDASPSFTTLLAGLAIFAGSAFANPKGGHVTVDSATISEVPGALTITQADRRAIIHWQDFSIGAGELTQFIQPDAKSATLNRVVGGIPSSIVGTLKANGQVYLINPNGILVGPSGVINTSSFVASTLDVPDAQFMAGGDMSFSGTSMAGVVNFGSITASDGDVILMARTVENAGTISAPNGVAALAAGSDILLQAAGDERVVVRSGIGGGGTGVLNRGTINAAQAELKAAGGNVYALAVHNTGVVKATGIAQKNGRIILSSSGGVVQNNGQLVAKNADGSGGRIRMDGGKGGAAINNGLIDAAASDNTKPGGTVEILGDSVTVGNGSVINASGSDGGTVAIGVTAETAVLAQESGGVAAAAQNPDARAAQQAAIEENSRILANSTSAGNGGRIVVWSEQQSVVGGVIEAQGGSLGGNGGLVETSGKAGLTIVPGTKVLTTAPNGKAGQWLLDPAGITIDAGPTDTAAGPPYNQNANTNHVAAADVLAALLAGSNVTISTSSSFPSTNRDIVVSAPLLMDNTYPVVTLTLDSAGSIAVNSAIGGIGSNVILTMQALGGSIDVAAGAPILMNGISAYATGGISLQDQVSAQNDKNIFLTNKGGNIAFSGLGQARTSINGTVFIANNNSADSTLSDGTSDSIVAGKLSIIASHQGIGTSANPLNTSVSRVEALVASNSLTTGGGIFLSNSGSALHIGGVDPSINGVQVSSLPGFGGIEITNNLADIVLDSASAERVTAPGNIKLITVGSGDIVIVNTSPNSVRSNNGSVTLTAAGDVIIGDSAHFGVNVRGQSRVDVTVGGDVSVSGSLLKAGGGNGLTVTAGGDINILSSLGFPAIMGTSGGAAVRLTVGAGHVFNNNTLSTGGVRTNLPDDVTNVIPTLNGSISINADDVTLNAPIIGGHDVTFIPVSPVRAFDVGTKDIGKLSFTVAELKRITADRVNIGTFFGTGDLVVSADITQVTSFKSLLLNINGSVLVDRSINLPSGTVTLNSFGSPGGITGAGNITSAILELTANGGPISLSGSITTGAVLAESVGTIDFSSLNNHIDRIGRIFRGGEFTVRNAQSVALIGPIIGSNLNSDVVIRVVGNIVMYSQIQASGSGWVTLEAAQGYFINNAGPSAIQTSAGARFRIYSADNRFLFNAGGLDGPGVASQQAFYPDDPAAPSSAFYFGAILPPPPPVLSDGTSKSETKPLDPRVANLSQKELEPLVRKRLELAMVGDIDALRLLPDDAEIQRRLSELGREKQQREEQERLARLAQWPPPGTISMDRQDIRSEVLADWRSDDSAVGKPLRFDTNFYAKMQSVPADQRQKVYQEITDAADATFWLSPKDVPPGAPTEAQQRAVSLTMMEQSLVFDSQAALDQFLNDRGANAYQQNWRIRSYGQVDDGSGGPADAAVRISSYTGGKFFLYVGDGSPLGKPLPKPPAPVTTPTIVAQPAPAPSAGPVQSKTVINFPEPK